MERTKTITVAKLIKALMLLPMNTKVYLSSDSEGNSYSTLDNEQPFGLTEDEKSIILQPYHEGLDLDDIDSHASIRSDYYNKIYDECIAKGESDEDARMIAIREAYDSDAPFNN